MHFRVAAPLPPEMQTFPMKTPLLFLVSLAVLTACNRAETPPATEAESPASLNEPLTPAGAVSPAAAVVVLAGKSGSEVTGELDFAATDGGVSVTGEISGLTQGSEHGFHVHEKGDCSAEDATTAGEHFNPGQMPHGGPTMAASTRHVGDMPNIMADEQGHATINGTVQDATLRDGGPNDLIGKAVIVHEKRDDYVTQPSGDSGKRIACGVIR